MIAYLHYISNCRLKKFFAKEKKRLGQNIKLNPPWTINGSKIRKIKIRNIVITVPSPQCISNFKINKIFSKERKTI
jgi:hypothetical protein